MIKKKKKTTLPVIKAKNYFPVIEAKHDRFIFVFFIEKVYKMVFSNYFCLITVVEHHGHFEELLADCHS